MKIGEKEYKANINNRVIWDIEEAFDNKPISKIMSEVEGFTMKQTGTLIWHTIKDEVSFEEFADSIKPTQYMDAAVEVGAELGRAFDTGSKKK